VTDAIFTEMAKLNLALWVARVGFSVECDTCWDNRAYGHTSNSVLKQQSNAVVAEIVRTETSLDGTAVGCLSQLRHSTLS
jgi:hypothetical protein